MLYEEETPGANLHCDDTQMHKLLDSMVNDKFISLSTWFFLDVTNFK